MLIKYRVQKFELDKAGKFWNVQIQKRGSAQYNFFKISLKIAVLLWKKPEENLNTSKFCKNPIILMN